MNNIITAGIVTFNPDLDRLKENVSAILPQVDKVVIFDNGSINQKSIELQYQNSAIIIKSDRNVGIAAALNGLMKKSEELGATWMLSLDQDSVCSRDFCEQMGIYLYKEDNFGIVAPVIVDRNVGIVGHNPEKEYKSVRTCITSGAFTRLDVWKQIGGYDESMFIDSVDFEFCYRVRKFGYQVIQVRDVQLLHELGNSEKKRFLFWEIDVTGHSAFRKYYIARNNVYYPLKHKLWLHFIRGFFRNIELVVITILYEEDKKNKIVQIIKGSVEGLGSRRDLDDNRH